VILRALPSRDYYRCHECTAEVSYLRSDLPEGFGHNLCDPCNEQDKQRGARLLARSARDADVLTDETADVRTWRTPAPLIDDLIDPPTFIPDLEF